MKKNLILLFIASLFFAACSPDYEILKSQTSIVLTADTSVKIIGQPITFTVIDGEGNDVTSEATITIDGTTITGNTFTSSTVGYFEAKADYYGIESQIVMINFHDGTEINFVKRLLIEDYTGTWCGYCPRVAYAIEQVKAQTDKVVAVGIHRPTSDVSSGNYDPYNYDTSELEAVINTPGYPKGFLNRMTQWIYPEPTNVPQAVALTQGLNPKLGLAMSSTVENGNISIDVNVKFGKDFNNLRLVVYILENGLIYEQHNYTSYYGGVDVIEHFEHNHVLRQCITPLLGEAITGNTTIANVYAKTFNVPIPASVANSANLEFVAFVVDSNNNAINVRSTHPGEIQEFEQL